MTIQQYEDIENGGVGGEEDLQKPLILPPLPHMEENKKIATCKDGETDDQNGSIAMVLLSTSVAVCGSFEFGSCVSPPA